ncbi:PSD1 and planctomycete cytochrome C domain-containing protein [Psychroserpens luteolus]|uniref:PSD1 and planctomycete cytochrome C domain-containing protein n=1 Tax=Psychroserpens luteolus TaxID=2855840 RepID=UPI001E5EC67E|nr:PSD1 and planctomycete cytochrome C domain-containing protein [Psychroserpens luteolus]
MKKKEQNKPFKWILYFAIPFVLVLCYKYISKTPKSDYVTVDSSGLTDANSTKEVPETVDYIFDVKPILSDRCYLCHGPDNGTREANLRLDTKEGAYAAIGENLDRFAVVPGDTLLSQMAHRINSTNPLKMMPPEDSNLSLNTYEKAVLTKWIAQGAVWKDHWAFVAPEKSKIPEVKNNNLVVNEIDNFIIQKLEEQGLSLSEKASKEKLIRRVYFDLTGLPPSLADIDAFLADNSNTAYEKIVDRLLNSTQYGEHMTASWLDVSRYSDTHGYQDDLERVMWPWRDWVISAFNRNIPYDEFIKWQLAGDLLPDATLEQILATGFNRNHKITQEGGVIDEEYRVEYVLDRTNTVSKSLLGLTMECAQCHDHKYDPISQKEYFSFYSFFNKVKEKGRMDYGEIPEPNIKITEKEIDEVLSFINKPDSIPEIDLMVMRDDAPNRKTYVLKRGAYDAHGEEVEPATPKAVLPFDGFKKNRLGLANWFFDEKNTLTARVAVNRLWQQIFGVGIVASSSDFGNQGALPSHPELLDWLAITFREDGWDMKKMMRRMVMSSTYQQTSKATPELLEIDPYNKWLARSSRQKLTAEMIRDNALAVSGLLVEKVGGPSVKPYQPKGLWAETTSGQGLTEYIMDTGENLYRRSLYTFWKRTVPPPAMLTFDAATRDFCTIERQKTSTPLQALVMLNDPQLIEASTVLATQLLKDKNLTDKKRIQIIFRKITSRAPEEFEVDNLLNFLSDSEANYDDTKRIQLTEKREDISEEKLYALSTLTSLIFNLDEAIVKG